MVNSEVDKIYRKNRNNGIEVRVKPGDVFYVKKVAEFPDKEAKIPRRYRAIKAYKHYMLCESLMGVERHRRCFGWFDLKDVRIE